MFTQKLSMDCSQEQYEKYLKAELEKMGYEEGNDLDGQYIHITNRYNNKAGVVNGLCSPNIEFFGRTYLGKFNADLFLALAAMTDDEFGGIGEYWIKTNGGMSFNEGELYAAIGFYGDSLPMFIDKNGSKNGILKDFFNKEFRKATVSEIMAKFGEQPKKDIFITLAFEKEPIWENCEKLIDEYEAILLLKSKGYRIFKQTTTLEEV